MEWIDEAVILAVRPHGETGAIAEVLARRHGRHLGLVHGGASRKRKGMLQPGNTVQAKWRARVSEQLGSFALEPVKDRAGALMESAFHLAGLRATAAILGAALAEREPHEPVYRAFVGLLDAAANTDPLHWAAMVVRFEAGLLAELGYGLDLARCAATGTAGDLAYVSPHTGRAVCREAGAEYRDKLLALPAFMLGKQADEPTALDIAAGLRLTGTFLEDHVLRPHGKPLPAARARFADAAAKLRTESDKRIANSE